ncbi:hypothetical protein FQN55_006061 [Onygenales sp. PD_40]|nr:hypothetical protein FQN55_006061 [Onygenales sp. PD_40]KAK2803769.1 hypothetical protein FQN51_002999 [Onygenales sp. PD_10]
MASQKVETGAPPPAADYPIANIEVDNDETDSSYGEDELSRYTTSVTSSVYEYRFKDGRRYHSYQAGNYQFPNDQTEQDRLDFIHHIYYRLLGDKLFLAPINPGNGTRILDIGTGTGLWPTQMGDLYPEAELILGNDLSPIQPQWVPKNVKFIVDDVEQEWAEEQQFDFIHCRYMCGSIVDWPRLVKQCFDNLKPGGWVEFHDTNGMLYAEDDSLKPGNAIIKMLEGLNQACDKIGRTLDVAPRLQGWVRNAGFTNIKQDMFKLPLGTWPKDKKLKEIGACMAQNFIVGTDAFTLLPFTEILGWSKDEVSVLNEAVRTEIRNKNGAAHLLYDVAVVTAQKPLDA